MANCCHGRLGRFRGVEIYLGRAFFVRVRGVGRDRGLVALEGFSIMVNIGKKDPSQKFWSH